MINIYRSIHGGEPYDVPINHFYKREWVKASEVVVMTKKDVFGHIYRYAVPAVQGDWAS